MPNVKVRVYDTQNNHWMFDQNVDVDTMSDVANLIGYSSGNRYTDRATREDPFQNMDKLVSGDITIFCAPAKSKAGRFDN